jgi:formylglycine-generating enzyme required for sulfatase activity
MGSPVGELGQDINEQQHQVKITRRFLILSTEVSQGSWTTVMGTNPSSFSGCGSDCPVETIDWFTSIAYANKLSALASLELCYNDPDDGTAYDLSDAASQKVPVWTNGLDCLGYRLPTEAEWEYAARAGTTTAFYTGGITTQGCSPLDPKLDLAGWYCGNSSPLTHSSKLKQPNAWGLYDVLGNVWEWTWDTQSDYPTTTVTDPLGGPTDIYSRMARGGSFYGNPGMCRSAVRGAFFPVASMEAIGVRIARTLP